MITPTLLRPTIINHLKLDFSKSFTARNLSLKPRLPKFPSFKLTPDPPGNIVGTVNDAYVPPQPEISKGSFHWAYERLVVLGMTPLIVFPFIAGVDYPLVDAILSSLILLHSRYGFQSCIIDYIPKRKFGTWHKLAMILLNIGSFTSLYGIYVIETENNGLADLIYKMWTV
ncbi:hypothetical protein CANINC_001983 [Pichia inconspicua]|uniref:Succinate dehydrogenase [ubiquinone] cytochrome b small subunit n=1 Tax=Pichia inconspicua TaxID=52247 RepID=A0A4V4NFU0_9ASCO|nr:hypothetical protein CANINC_001983 [[Candida] inconspicua]